MASRAEVMKNRSVENFYRLPLSPWIRRKEGLLATGGLRSPSRLPPPWSAFLKSGVVSSSCQRPQGRAAPFSAAWRTLIFCSTDGMRALLEKISQSISAKKRRTFLVTGIDKSLALERKIESRKRNFSLDLKNLIVSISLSTLDFREW